MQTKFAICLAVALSLPALAVPASAQYVLPPHEITTSVRSMGLQPVSRPVLRPNGGRYVLHAIDRRGVEVRVAADAFTGRILAVRPLGYPAGPAYAGRPNAYGYYPMPQREYPGEVVRPPASVPMPPSGAQQSARVPSDPPIIYAPGSKPEAAPPARPPVAGKPATAPKVAAKPKLAEPPKEKAADKPQPESDTTGTTSSSAAENTSVAIPPVQSFE